MIEQLQRAFARATQLFNIAPHNSTTRDELDNAMEAISKLNMSHLHKRVKPENYVLRGQKLIDKVKSIDKFLNGEEALKSHYYKQPEPEGLKEETDIKKRESTELSNLNKKTEFKEGQLSLSIRGGARKGAGRKAIGIKKPVSINLPESAWNEIDNLIQNGKFSSYAEYFRWLFENKPSAEGEKNGI